MNSSSTTLPSSAKNAPLASVLSLFIPGAGQVYLRSHGRGVAIFTTTLVLAFLINWALDNFRIGRVAAGGVTTSWLWGGLALFWAWNVFDAHRRTRGGTASNALGLALPALMIYFIAWQVTDVNLDRLVTRFEDTKIIFRALIHPDLFEREEVSQIGGFPLWLPCTTPPQSPFPPGAGSGYPLRLDKSCAKVGDPLTIRGEGYIPGTVGYVHWVDVKDEIQVREGGQAVTVVVGEDGRFEKTLKVPAFAGREGLDPNNPVQQVVEVRFTQEVGAPQPSENFGDLIGKIAQKPPPDLLVQLGLFHENATMPSFVPGKIFETIALGLMATLFSILFAVPLSFFAAHNIMSRIPGGMLVYYAMRTFLNVVRSIDTLIWGLIVIVWIGLGPFAGMLALGIHSVAALGKLYSEEIEHIDPGPIEAVTATGANLIQVIRYAVIPQIVPPFLAYTLLRWEINMPSATIVVFLPGGVIGFFVVETIRKGGYEQYAAALWVVAVVIMLVDYVSARWRERILVGETRVRTELPRPFYKSPRALAYVILALAVFVYSWELTGIDLKKLLDPGPTFMRLVGDFIEIDLSPDLLDTVTRQMLITIFQALIATTLGGAVALPFSFLAARNLTGRSRLLIWIYYLTRGMFNFLRSIEALLYSAIFVFWVGIGAFAGALALAVTTFALIGKLFSEAIENIDPGSVEAVTATGATRLQTIVYAILPQIIPPFTSYAIYQWDINIRIATIIGFAGGGGIGLLFYTYFNQLQYHKAGTVVAMIVIVITLMDFASARIRERLV